MSTRSRFDRDVSRAWVREKCVMCGENAPIPVGFRAAVCRRCRDDE